MSRCYKFIPYSEYALTETRVDDEGVEYEEHVSPYWKSHPKARVNADKTEVVLSCSKHGPSCNCVTRDAALQHIEANWPPEPEEV